MKKASILFSEGGQIGAFISHFDFLYLQKARKPIKRRKHNDAIIHFGHSPYTDARCQVY